ncbi:MAG: hypothetical protein JF887_01680 [Candidatus Dormibacteraeota bacterium]|uniref:Ribbon-helix-helix protein CopG domain-containing protein n=1 Tax=Candidatus Amunia macphersoniae TaxID=3127014 RepID=A0A934KHZ5_9BACT|nr:hypothetical protein [Candidatus Dormibacteraeota bacterium]
MIRRTTLSAESADLAVIEAEARRRGVSLATVLKEVVAEAAAARRITAPRPRWGVVSSGVGDLAHRVADDEDSPAAGRLRS